MSRRLEEALARLEAVSAELDKISETELESVETLLAKRGQAAAQVGKLLADGQSPAPAHLARLKAVCQAGERLRDQLLVGQARRRLQLGELYQTQFLLKALAPGNANGSAVDCLG